MAFVTGGHVDWWQLQHGVLRHWLCGISTILPYQTDMESLLAKLLIVADMNGVNLLDMAEFKLEHERGRNVAKETA